MKVGCGTEELVQGCAVPRDGPEAAVSAITAHTFAHVRRSTVHCGQPTVVSFGCGGSRDVFSPAQTYVLRWPQGLNSKRCIAKRRFDDLSHQLGFRGPLLVIDRSPDSMISAQTKERRDLFNS
jgi:hypothetical protein